jgi:hypothetical protein
VSAQTKAELLEGLGARTTKADLVDLLGSKLKKDELASLLDDDGGATKDELVRKLGSKTKDELVEAVGAHLTKDEVQRAVDTHTQDDGNDRDDRDTRNERAARDTDPGADSDDTDVDWNAELDWAPPPRPTPAPVQFAGAPPFMPGKRVRVDVAGLPMLGVFAGKGASAAGTIVGVDARARTVRVYLDAVFDGSKEIVVPPERITPDG